MAPPITSSKSVPRKEHRLGTTSASREATPTSKPPDSAMANSTATGNADLATVFKKDLTNIRNLVTCSICDQLLYEPWTLGCGHTYCYTCLCSWFVLNRRKKTCPECRTRVKQMPAPNFLVKQMVEIFTARTELMPPDESVDQHKQKRAEEIADVEKDRNSAEGLFKGTFPERGGQLFLDEADGVLRCPNCHHEHEGGPSCANCGAEIDDERYGFSDVDEDEIEADLEDLELDLDHDLEAELEIHDGFFANHRGAALNQALHRRLAQHRFEHPHHHHHEVTDSDASEPDSEEEEEGSLQDFVVQDEDELPRSVARNSRPGARHRATITADTSDDESDEGGQVTDRRIRRRNMLARTSSPSNNTVVTDTSNNSDMRSEADLLRIAGWSPLDHGTDSEPEVHPPYEHRRYQYDITGDEHDSDEDSDTNTETMVGNGATDDEDDRLRDDMSETPTYDGNPYHPDFQHYEHEMYEHLGDETDDDASDVQSSVMMDRDGDTEMSVSPDRRRSVSVSTNPYRQDSESRSSREPSVCTRYDYTDGPSSLSSGRGGSVSTRRASVDTNHGGYGNNYVVYPGENLGAANNIQEMDGESSDASIRPPPRRRRQFHSNTRVQQTDPRISMMFAEHQQSVRGTQSRPVDLEELDEWAQGDVRRVVEPGSRNRRMTAYRVMLNRRIDPLRTSRSPSATRITSSSTDRPFRPARQYIRGSRN